MAFLKSLNKFEKLGVIVAIVFLMVAGVFLVFAKPTVTGFVPATYAIKDIDVVVLSDKNYVLCANDSQLLELTSVMVSGKVVGNGDAKIFVETEGERHLVYSNEPEAGIMSVTGFAIKETGERADIQIDFLPEFEEEDFLDESQIGYYEDEVEVFLGLLEKEAEENKKEIFVDFIKSTDGVEFQNECAETCMLFGLSSDEYKFVFEVDAGTVLFVDEIVYTIENP